jgi:hypothetical protein
MVNLDLLQSKEERVLRLVKLLQLTMPLDTRSYDVVFEDGREASYTANLIAESMYAQCDIDGNQHLLLKAIVDHTSNDQALKDQNWYVVVNGRYHPHKTTAGWFLAIEWKDRSTSWEKLNELKESFPIEVAEYAVANWISDAPAFAWWVHKVLFEKHRIVKAVNSRYLKRTHRFGIEIPKTVKQALEIDADVGSNHWHDAIVKEINAVRVAFDILKEGKKPPPGYQNGLSYDF